MTGGWTKQLHDQFLMTFNGLFAFLWCTGLFSIDKQNFIWIRTSMNFPDPTTT